MQATLQAALSDRLPRQPDIAADTGLVKPTGKGSAFANAAFPQI